MSIHAAAREAATAQGWSTTTLLDVCLDFIAEQADGTAFLDYLSERGAAANRAVGAHVTDAVAPLPLNEQGRSLL